MTYSAKPVMPKSRAIREDLVRNRLHALSHCICAGRIGRASSAVELGNLRQRAEFDPFVV